MEVLCCAYCREKFEGEPVKRKDKLYCSEACAFQDSLKIGSICGSQSTVEASRRFQGTRQEYCGKDII